jgi:hypothetical protein
MKHFVSVDHHNIFRLPVGWQYLLNNQLGGTLDATKFANYDQLVQGCLSTGASCIIDIHNYARWNGQIIGQGGPTNAQYASLWSQLATKYKGNSKILFGLMNEPHGMFFLLLPPLFFDIILTPPPQTSPVSPAGPPPSKPPSPLSATPAPPPTSSSSPETTTHQPVPSSATDPQPLSPRSRTPTARSPT